MKAIKVFETSGPQLLGSEDEGTGIFRNSGYYLPKETAVQLKRPLFGTA